MLSNEIAALEQHPALQEPLAASPELCEEHTVYFDTADLRLARKGLSLRIRRHGNRLTQTLKSSSDGGAVAAARGEWEWPVDQDVPDLARLANTPFGTEIAAEAGCGLQPVFETDIRRSVRSLRLAGNTVVEVAIDQGHVAAGPAMQEIRELELELKSGIPGPLYRLALALHSDIPFTIGAESKAQRGYRLRTGEAPQATEGAVPKLAGACPITEAVRQIVGAELGHFLANQPAAAAGAVEGVHQMRVGIRRLRTALALFAKYLEPVAARRFEAELKRLGNVFGAARDWDVFCTQTLREAAGDAAMKVWVELLQPAAEARRQIAHRRVADEIGHRALAALVLGMAAWLEPDEAATAGLGDNRRQRRLKKHAPILLDRMDRRVAKRGGHLGRRSSEELHDFRKSLKKLRYSADYLAAPYPSRSVKRYQKCAKRLLKLLGEGNDAAMAITLSEQLDAGQSSDLVPAIGALNRWAEERRAKSLRQLPKAWLRFNDTPLFWH
ncbi:MAG: CHAD domain-containing protein [Alphaproteobacteria bacterium]|nr:CHAD domain-containing protein [Alphaproteobacteria bacterium]